MAATTFVYKALDRNGGVTTGEHQGDDKAQVAAQLRLRGLTVIDVEEKSSPMTFEAIMDRYKRVKPSDMTVLARQLATMVSSGLSLLRALYVLEDQTLNTKLKAAIAEIRARSSFSAGGRPARARLAAARLALDRPRRRRISASRASM